MYSPIGVYPSRGLGRCGLCGQQRKMTEAHVPPQSTGNRGGSMQRAYWMNTPDGARLSPWQDGGLSVYGLCEECNHVTSVKADPAYAEFHRRVTRIHGRRVLIPADLPARVAPGLVARSVLAGMFAINSDLYQRAPELARGIRCGDDGLRLPEDLRLCIALNNGPRSRIGGPVGYMRVLGRREFHMPLAEVWFPPLAWCIRVARTSAPSLGQELTASWGDATDWIRYGSDLETDLRNIVSRLPTMQPPQFGADEWVIMSSDQVMTAVDGRPKPLERARAAQSKHPARLVTS